MSRVVPLFTLEGVPDAEISTHHFSTEDKLGLSLLRFQRAPSDDVVLLVHGQTASSDMFIMPEHRNLVSYLLDNGFTDVWTLDSRMSNRYPYNLPPHSYCMDDVALYDFPAALARMREEIGDRRIHVICHCLGSVAFTMSLFGRAIDGIASVISNGAALTPAVHRWARAKSLVGPFLVESVFRFPFANPNWHEGRRFSLGKALAKGVSMFHHECDVPACHMLSFMWGAGWPAMYEHENLNPVTHERIGDLLGGTTLNYHRHTMKMIRAGNRAVKWDPTEPQVTTGCRTTIWSTPPTSRRPSSSSWATGTTSSRTPTGAASG
ncbi:MAG: alpha/beta fold hydrolase [Dehalococcoidia bacterium]|nr:alpha/beta fold hydrolase [Dehalococcoidia bacterium]